MMDYKHFHTSHYTDFLSIWYWLISEDLKPKSLCRNSYIETKSLCHNSYIETKKAKIIQNTCTRNLFPSFINDKLIKTFPVI